MAPLLVLMLQDPVQTWLALQDPPVPYPNESALFELPTDVTGAARRPQPLSRAPSSIVALTQDDLEKLGTRTLTDALRSVAGLEVTRISATEVNIAARGMNDESSASQGIMGLLDGRQTYNEFLGTVLWESLPVHIQDIEQVEVLLGPGSFLYGPNALHGLVNIKTRSPLSYEADRVFLYAAGGSYASNTESVIYVRRQGDTALKIKLLRDDINEFERGDDTRNKLFLEGRFETLVGEHRFDVTAGVGKEKSDVLIAPFGSVDKEVFENDIEDGFLKALYTWGGLRAQATWTRFLSESGLRFDVYTPFSLKMDAADLDLQYDVAPIAGHTLTVGVGYRRATFDTQDENISLGRHHTGVVWGFVQDEWELAENLWITGGLRIDDHSEAGTSLSPRLALVWEVANGHTLRASAGVGYRNPSLREIWLNLPVTVPNPTPPPDEVRIPISGNPDLEPEKLRSMELAYSGTALGFLRLRTTAFYNLVDHLIHFVELPTPHPENNGKDQVFGGEAEAEFLISESLLVFGNYTYVVRRDRDTHEVNTGAPRNAGNAGIRFTNSGGWGATLWVTAVDSVQFIDPNSGDPLEGEADAYALLNARVAYSFTIDATRGTVFIQGLNILDHDHREHPHGESYGAVVNAGVEVSW
jgi:outer membrane receptor protein involved in Fe transport